MPKIIAKNLRNAWEFTNTRIQDGFIAPGTKIILMLSPTGTTEVGYLKEGEDLGENFSTNPEDLIRLSELEYIDDVISKRAEKIERKAIAAKLLQYKESGENAYNLLKVERRIAMFKFEDQVIGAGNSQLLEIFYKYANIFSRYCLEKKVATKAEIIMDNQLIVPQWFCEKFVKPTMGKTNLHSFFFPFEVEKSFYLTKEELDNPFLIRELEFLVRDNLYQVAIGLILNWNKIRFSEFKIKLDLTQRQDGEERQFITLLKNGYIPLQINEVEARAIRAKYNYASKGRIDWKICNQILSDYSAIVLNPISRVFGIDRSRLVAELLNIKRLIVPIPVEKVAPPPPREELLQIVDRKLAKERRMTRKYLPVDFKLCKQIRKYEGPLKGGMMIDWLGSFRSSELQSIAIKRIRLRWDELVPP